MKTFRNIVIGVAVVAALAAGIIALVKLSYREIDVEVRHTDSTFTLIGHCRSHWLADCGGPKGQAAAQNAVTRKAGQICGLNAQTTEKVYKLGDQRVVVVCK